MYEGLTRQQRRAIERQKYHKDIPIGSVWQAKVELRDTHPKNGRPTYRYIRIFSINTPERIEVLSPYGTKARISPDQLKEIYEQLSIDDARQKWALESLEAEAVKNVHLSREELIARFVENNKDMIPILYQLGLLVSDDMSREYLIREMRRMK